MSSPVLYLFLQLVYVFGAVILAMVKVLPEIMSLEPLN